MSAVTCSRALPGRSGGKSRVGDPAADGADGPFRPDPVGVDAGGGGGGAGQGAERVVGQQVAPQFLLDHVRGLRPQDLARAAQERLELRVRGLVLPALLIGRREHRGGGLAQVRDGGDQGDQLVLPVAVGDLVLDDPDVPGLVRVQVQAGAGGPGELPWPAP